MKQIVEKLANVYTAGTFIIGMISGVTVMYYNYQEKVNVLQKEVELTRQTIQSLEKEDENIHAVLHLHYKKMLELK